jgi:hypothetical protein
MVVAGIVVSQFAAALAIINSEKIAFAILGEFLRYGLVLLVITSICFHISQAYELSQFERILSMPIHRGQYILAQTFVVLSLSLVASMAVLLSCLIFSSWSVSLYWFLAVFLELVLSGLFAMLAIMSLEKLPVAILLSISIYLLSRLVPLIDVSLYNASEFFSDEVTYQFSDTFIRLVQYVLPGREAFAQNNMLFENTVDWTMLLKQFVAVLLYGAFIILISTVDFYRKEFRA